MFRKNTNQRSGPRGGSSSGKWGPKKESASNPRKVSPNYTVNLMHHNTNTNAKPNPYGQGGGQGGGQRPPRHVGVYQAPKTQHRMRSGVPFESPALNTVTIQEELFNSLEEKATREGKTAEEILNRLAQLYIEGKIQDEPPSE
jgi:hypothetical protein